MSSSDRRNILTGLKVREAMRRQLIGLRDNDQIKKAISYLIKFKVNAILITDKEGKASGVVSKTDIMAAYYAALPMESNLGDIMIGPPIVCKEEDSLEPVMEMMRTNGIYRVFVAKDSSDDVIGLLAYPDIVGLLYRFCRNCRHNYLFAGKHESDEAPARRFTVKEVMTDRVESFEDGDDLNTLIEGLSQYRFGAVLIKDASGRAVGIVSKTDLIVAYRHGLSPHTKAKDIMSQGVRACQKDAYLAEAIQQMILSDVLRLFVYEKEPDQIVGVLSFTDAARIRSGSCSACLASRIKIDDEAP